MTVLQLAFLGFSEHFRQFREGNSRILRWNILGLTNIVVIPFLPLTFIPWHFIFAGRSVGAVTDELLDIPLRIVSDDNVEIGFITIRVTAAAPSIDAIPSSTTEFFGWKIFTGPDETPVIFTKPGRYFVKIQNTDGYEEPIGEFYFVLADPPPLTPETIAAIRSDPHAAKAVRLSLGCKLCSKKMGVFAALDRRTSPVPDGFTWYEDIPDSFICDCGKTAIDLTTLRRNFFATLMLQVSGATVEEDGKRHIIYDPLYRASNLEGLNAEYNRLLNTNPPEEQLQQFIERNPILLRQFPASRILFKPPVLTFFKADFAILSPQRELVLIEIESTKTRLLKSNGGQAADLTHAVDQVRDWLITIGEHRLACLASLKINPDLVGPVRGVVIAGRDRGYNPDHLRRLKTTLSGQISLLTYDDLSASLGTLARELRSV